MSEQTSQYQLEVLREALEEIVLIAKDIHQDRVWHVDGAGDIISVAHKALKKCAK